MLARLTVVISLQYIQRLNESLCSTTETNTMLYVIYQLHLKLKKK